MYNHHCFHRDNRPGNFSYLPLSKFSWDNININLGYSRSYSTKIVHDKLAINTLKTKRCFNNVALYNSNKVKLSPSFKLWINNTVFLQDWKVFAELLFYHNMLKINVRYMVYMKLRKNDIIIYGRRSYDIKF